MILVSHRGNTHGPNPQFENHPKYIEDALSLGYNVEIDVRYVDGGFMLGHDEPQYLVNLEFFHVRKDRLWCHAKNLPALVRMIDMGLNCFWHENDGYTVTSAGYIWAYPGMIAEPSRTVCVMPEFVDGWKGSPFGVCSDYIGDSEILKAWNK